MKNRLHTLGNLAVIPKSINSEMSNERFANKKEILSSSVFVKLGLNTAWQGTSVDKWTPEQIDGRAISLVDDLLLYYPF